MILERTHLPPPPGGEHSAASSVLGLPVAAAPTALGLQALAGRLGLLELDAERIGLRLYPGESVTTSAERVVLHVLMLEEAGFLLTWAQDGREWLRLLDGGGAPSARGRAPWGTVQDSSVPAGPVAFSMAGEREREEARARARERARARADEEERMREGRWAAWEAEYVRRKPARPSRPAVLEAPPMGCPDHPHGSLDPCGPCGTAMERRREFLARQKYTEQLAVFEEHLEDEPWDPDEPF
ncbi:hypothetical protein [Microbacterium halotolerans]|uniref:hypothetical protein n=1 Tax=Microbacterium halotolerans TaxID=246613 RepID=UPI000E6ABFF4|nr:hypothetical protein [Microbacterium halotolerans]